MRTDDGLDLGERRFGVPQLDGEDDEIGDADGGRIFRDGHLREMEFIGAGDGEALFAHGREMGTARHEGDIGAALGEACAEIAADAPRSHHCDFHVQHPCRFAPVSTIVRHLVGVKFAFWSGARTQLGVAVVS